MAEAYYPTDNGSYTKWTPDMVGALGANFEGMSYKDYDGKTDWNELTAGIYYIGQASSFSADLHQPVEAYTYGILLVFSNNGNNFTQIYIAHADDNFWYRQRWTYDNEFCSWNKMITNTSIGGQSVNYANSSNYANSAGSSSTSTTAAHLGRNGDVNTPMNFQWSEKDGQPTWLWGGEDGTDMYVYNPANFKVNKSNETYKSWTTTHPDSWYLESNWDGSYFQVQAHNTGQDTLPVNVRKSDYSDYCNNERSVVISSTQPTDDKCKIWVKI